MGAERGEGARVSKSYPWGLKAQDTGNETGAKHTQPKPTKHRGAILTSFWRHRTAGAAGPACAASVHVSLLQRDQVGGPGYSRGRVLEAPDVL